MSQQDPKEFLMFVGTYTRRDSAGKGKSEGIYAYRFNSADASLTPVSTTSGIANPSFLAIDPAQRFLYAVSELGEQPDGKPGGSVTAFRIHREDGTLEYLNEQPTHGTSPCHLTVDATSRNVLFVSYGSGNLGVLPIKDDGSLDKVSDLIQHEGSSVNPQRQGEPHPHSINLGPNNRLALVPDLGTDKVMIYAFSPSEGKLTPNPDQPWARTKSGAGPRHLAFHPNHKFAYVCNELDSTVTGFAFDSDRGTLHEIQTLSSLPDDYRDKSYCADIHVHPNGKTVYVSNRGHDSIAVFDCDTGSGKLTLSDLTSTRGNFPRNFALDPTGNFLIAANQNSDDIFRYSIDAKSGKLTPIEGRLAVPTPVCIKFIGL